MTKTKAQIRDESYQKADCCWNCEHSRHGPYWTCFVATKRGAKCKRHDGWCKLYERREP